MIDPVGQDAPPEVEAVIEAELPLWTLVPTREGDGGLDEARWRELMIDLFDDLARLDLEAEVAPPALDVDRTLTDLLDMADSLDASSRLVAGFGVPGRWPLPVIVSAAQTDDDVDLLDLASARGGRPVEAPIVDDLPESSGPGVTVTRFDLDDERDVWATVSCARRLGGLDVVTLWRTNDPALVATFRDQVVRLIDTVRVATVTGTPSTIPSEGGDA